MTGYLGGDILSWHRVMFALHQHWGYSEEDLLNKIPYERDILLALINQHKKEQEQLAQQGAGVGPTYKLPKI